MYGASCQDVTGVWKGKLTQLPGGCFPEYFIELQIQQKGKGLTGVTYDYYDTKRYVKVQFSARLNTKTKKIVISESQVLEAEIPPDCVPCIKTYELTWTKENDEEVLRGFWKGVELGSASSCPPGQLYLKKSLKSAFDNEAVNNVEKPAQVQQAVKPETRKIEIVKTLLVDTSKITLELYDNGQVDGDTISIFLNEELILRKKKLSEKPITLDIPVEADRDYKVILFADNLGSIPPNTALMVVTAGKRKYEIYLSSTEQKSAAVIFRYDKK